MDESTFETIRNVSDLKESGLERRSFMRRIVGSGAAVTLGSSLAGCTGDGDADGVPNELVVARAGDADNLDPHVTTAQYASYVMSLIYDPLMLLDFDGAPTPALGNGWEVSDDETEWTIELKDGVEFHNGDQLTADDVVFTFNRLLEESSLGWTVGSLQEIEEIDEMTVRFYFEEPYAPWTTHTTSAYFGILPRGPVEDDPDSFAVNPIGTGPYELTEWARDDRIVLERNDNWVADTYPEVQSDDPPNPQQITIRIIPEDTPRIQELETGGIDMIIDDLPSREVQGLEDNNDIEVFSYLSTNYNYVQIHNQLAPTDEVEVRKAMAYAINREQIIQDIHFGMAEPNPAPISENLLGWGGEQIRERDLDYEYDPETAREFLEDAGWEDTGGEVRERNGEELHLEMVAPNAPSAALQTAEEVMAMLTDVGFSVDLTPFEPATANVEMEEGDYHVHGFSALAWVDPSVMAFQLHSDNIPFTNSGRVAVDAIDENIDRGNAAIDPDERAEYYQQAQIEAMERAVCVPLMTTIDSVAHQQEVSGFDVHPTTLSHIFHDVTME